MTWEEGPLAVIVAVGGRQGGVGVSKVGRVGVNIPPVQSELARAWPALATSDPSNTAPHPDAEQSSLANIYIDFTRALVQPDLTVMRILGKQSLKESDTPPPVLAGFSTDEIR